MSTQDIQIINNTEMCYTCPNCNKQYKSQAWFNKHTATCVAPVAEVVAEPVVEVVSAPVFEVVASPVTQDADNLKSEQFEASPFYFTIKAKAKCGDNYTSPLYKALSENAGKITLCREKESLKKAADGKAKAYKSYGNMTFAQLSNIWQQNHHLYEVIKSEHKPYFDIEFKPNTKEEQQQIMTLILRLIKTSFESIGVIYNVFDDSAFAKNIGTGEAGVFAGLTKASFHLIINNGYKFVSHEDSNKFAKYLEQRIRTEEEYKPLITAEGIAIDLKVYNKNRCFKLPNQSKAGSTRIQTVSKKFTRQTLTDFLISENIANSRPIDVSGITLTFDAKIKKVKGASNTDFSGVNWNWTAIEEFKNSMVNVNHIVNIDGEPSYNIEYLVDSIYNGKEVSFKTWFQVGSAIKRCVEDNSKAIELFAKWTRKYDANATVNSVKTNFDSFASDTCGFKTLLSLARLCNPKLDDYVNNIHKSLFVTDKMPADIINITVDKRYIDFADIIPGFTLPQQITIEQALNGITQGTKPKCISPKTTNTYFIKSPMGTGKTFNFINYIKHQEQQHPAGVRLVYLSSRKAFAESTAADFKSVDLVSYLKHDVTRFRKVIISLESINRLTPEQINDNDILVVDESESIFNIFSSSTLINSEYIDKIKILNTLIKKSKQVFCMDAFLTNRSIQSIMSCRPVDKTNTIYYVNTYKYAERQYVNYPTKDSMISEIKAKLTAGKRVCLVSGSSNYGQIVSDSVKIIPDIKVKYYNAKNPLCLTADVNTEWADCNLLIYSPTITCGISYTNDLVKFDNLYIYATNKGSCHFRDIIQAHKRIRNFTDSTIGVFLNTEFDGFNAEQYPTYCDEIKQIYSTYRKELFNTTNNIESILDNDCINWVYDIHCYNIMERNIHSIYLEKVARHYFELENIKQKAHSRFDMTTEYCNADKPIWISSQIPNITVETYELLNAKIQNKTITEDEYKQWSKFWFRTILKDNAEFDTLFNEWFKHENVEFISNITKFNTIVNNNGIVRSENSVALVELFDKNILAMEHTFKILKALKVITCETITLTDGTQKDKHKLNIGAEFNTLDFEALAEQYKTISSKAINQLFSDEYLKTVKDGKKIEFSSRTMKAIIDKLLKENFGYKTVNIGNYTQTIDGKRKQITKYAIDSDCVTNLFANLK